MDSAYGNGDTAIPRGVRDSNFEPNMGSAWISMHWAQLPSERWVAADPEGQIATDPTFDGLIKILKEKNVDPENVAIAYIEKDEL